MTIAAAAMLLFLILDPLGNIPVFLSLLKGLPPARQRVVIVRELLIALGVLMLFLWAGPSGMAAVMLLGSQEPGRMGAWSLALAIAWAATAIILFSATYLQKWLGTRVLTAIERLMGMVIVAISVQMLLDGIASYLRAGS